MAIAFLTLLAVPSLAAARGPLLYSIASNDVVISRGSGAVRVSVPASAQLAWFTDRPARDSGTGTAADIAAGWVSNGFDRVPPNAALVTKRGSATMQTIVTLRNPVVADGRVSFAYRALGDHRMLGMRTTGRPQAGRYRGELFVDDATVPPCASAMLVGSSTQIDCIAGVGTTYFVDPIQPSGTGSSGATVAGCAPYGSGATAYVTTTSGSEGDLSRGQPDAIDVLPCAQSQRITLGSATVRTQCVNTGKRIPYCTHYQSALSITVNTSLRLLIG